MPMPKQPRDRVRAREEKTARWMQSRIQARKSRKGAQVLMEALDGYVTGTRNLETVAPEHRETAERALRDLEGVLIGAGLTREKLTELVEEGLSIDLPEP